jgi:hypothetical protein
MSTDLTVREPMSAGEYFAADGLSASGMKDLEVSPLRYWYLHINPDAPLKIPTPEMEFGTALHCAVLEPDQFDQRFAREFVPPDNVLDTINEIRAFAEASGFKPKGTRKDEVIQQVLSIFPDAPILQVLDARYLAKHEGKTIIKLEIWERVAGAARALVEEPEVRKALSAGSPEVAMTAKDPETGVTLKARIDWVRDDLTMDLKTFAQQRGKSIDRSINDSIWYEKYYRQAYFYSLVRGLQGSDKAASAQSAPPFLMPFVESEQPHETRIRELRPKIGTEVNLWWERARVDTRRLIRQYAECLHRYGAKHWREWQGRDPLVDEDMKALAFD